MPTVILEAMARSCAVIATDVGAVSELVDSSNGVLVPSNDTEALKSAILSILNTSNCKLETLKQASLDRVQNYTWSKVIERQISQFKTTQ
jgi:glycosyltransferase involved in cell wall biosynthesis